MKKNYLYCLFLFFAAFSYAGDTVRPGLEGLARQYGIPDPVERSLIMAIKEPFLAEKNVQEALEDWFAGRLLEKQNKNAEAQKIWQDALKKLDNLEDLPSFEYIEPSSSELKFLTDLQLRNTPDVLIQVVSWKVENLLQYGLLLRPAELQENHKYRLILYGHGAAFGIPNSFCSWLAENLVQKGYIVIAPAMRGETLFQRQIPILGKELVCEGEIENLAGEVDDCMSMLKAAWKLPYIQENEFAFLGHSFGSGAGLLTVALSGAAAKLAISYDAWLVNPQRYYWDRMRRGANNWLSWEDYCNQPVNKQLKGLQQRSIIHNVEKIQAKLLLFMGGAYDGSVFHESHQDLIAKLEKYNKDYEYFLVPDGDHNFVLWDGEPAKYALKIQEKILQKYYPPKETKMKKLNKQPETEKDP